MQVFLPVEGGWTPYGLLMAFGVVGGLILTWALHGTRAMKAGIAAAAAGLVVGHAVWGLVMLDFLDGFAEPGWLFFLEPWLGGNALYGAVFGALIGAGVFHLATRRKGQDTFLALLDCLAPGACLALIAGRVAEVFNGQGIGEEVLEPAMQFFPLAVCTYAEEDFSMWQVCVWFWEAMAAACLFVALMAMRRRAQRRGQPLPAGRQAYVFVAALACTQILLEQLRRDDALKFGFVISFTQIAAAATLVGAMVIRAIRRGGLSAKDLLRFAVVAAGLLTMIFAEFVIDKPQYTTALIVSLSAETLCAAVLLCAARRAAALAWRIPAALILCGAAAAAAVLLPAIEEADQVLMTYGIMALALLMAAVAALTLGRRDEKILIGRREAEVAAP